MKDPFSISKTLFDNWYQNSKWGVSAEAFINLNSQSLDIIVTYSTPEISNVQNVSCILEFPGLNTSNTNFKN